MFLAEPLNHGMVLGIICGKGLPGQPHASQQESVQNLLGMDQQRHHIIAVPAQKQIIDALCQLADYRHHVTHPGKLLFLRLL